MGKRSPVLIFAALAAVVLLSAVLPLVESSDRHHHHHHGHRSHVQGHGGEEAVVGKKGRMWPCCDNCGGCTRSIPPQCTCQDASRGGCHPACKDCVKSSLSVDPPVYQCMDRITNFCQRRCSAVAAH